jgi:hypothetical protein
LQVEVEHCLPLIGIGVGKVWLDVTASARVVDEDPRPTELVASGRHHAPKVITRSHIDLDEPRDASAPFDHPRRLLTRLRIDIRNDHRRPLRGKSFGYSRPVPAPAPVTRATVPWIFIA